MIVARQSQLTSLAAVSSNSSPDLVRTAALSSSQLLLAALFTVQDNSRQLNALRPLGSLFAPPVLCFQSLAASFAKKWGVGYTHAPHPFGISNIQTLFSRRSCDLVNAIPAKSHSLPPSPRANQFCPPFVFILSCPDPRGVQTAFPANPFFSHPSASPESGTLSFSQRPSTPHRRTRAGRHLQAPATRHSLLILLALLALDFAPRTKYCSDAKHTNHPQLPSLEARP
jgi:hypothetical protein